MKFAFKIKKSLVRSDDLDKFHETADRDKR